MKHSNKISLFLSIVAILFSLASYIAVLKVNDSERAFEQQNKVQPVAQIESISSSPVSETPVASKVTAPAVKPKTTPVTVPVATTVPIVTPTATVLPPQQASTPAPLDLQLLKSNLIVTYEIQHKKPDCSSNASIAASGYMGYGGPDALECRNAADNYSVKEHAWVTAQMQQYVK